MNALRHLAQQIQARWRGEEVDDFHPLPEATTTTPGAATSLSLPMLQKKPRLLRMPQRDKSIFAFTARLNSDLTEPATHLKAGSAVLLNLQNVSSERGQRLVDFMFGVATGLEGHCQQVGDKLFMFAPPEYMIVAEEQTNPERLMSDGFMIRERLSAPSSLIDDSELPSARRTAQMRFG